MTIYNLKQTGEIHDKKTGTFIYKDIFINQIMMP